MEDHIRFDSSRHVLDLLDQRLLPAREKRFLCSTTADVITAIKTMVVRGAPAIGVSAAFGCALAVREAAAENRQDWQAGLDRKLGQLAASRPTAVNLAWAVDRQRSVWESAQDADPERLYNLFVSKALEMQAEDIASCKAIGKASLELVHQGDCILTHCNAGALATAGYGTALAVVRAAWEAGLRISVIADETRPLLQGARLTCWELHKEGIPVTLACDNSCACLMSKGKVQLVVVGADRIAANGDTANKIGTMGVALLARHFSIPFYVAAPVSTIDPALKNGAGIPIEQRSASEVTSVLDRQIAPRGVPAYNFAFDVTPAEYITAIITDQGLLRPPFDRAIARLDFNR
ncbi:MAG: S-methyl-5-thioribose-1-phosphate isomerase [Desulfovibrionaceae bacterium]|nr:S-methyl-5-thioribose-1-phosphate isomerase [Desulfovibrionaceae bacterium]